MCLRTPRRHAHFTCQVDSVVGCPARCVSYNRHLIVFVLKESMRKTVFFLNYLPFTKFEGYKNGATVFTVLKMCA